MMAELNEAYSILRNDESRAKYDSSRPRNHQSHASRESREAPSPRSPLEPGELSGGQMAFDQLPPKVQKRLVRRQRNEREDAQFQVKLDSIGWQFGYIALLSCWFWYLFADVNGAPWKNETIGWYGLITVVSAWLIGRNVLTILRWNQAKLKSFFYVTPVYFIKTEFDLVSFWPLWSLKDCSVTHNHKNGAYQDTDVLLSFPNVSQALSFSSKAMVEMFLARVQGYSSKLRTAMGGGDTKYIFENDDFSGVARSHLPPRSDASNLAQLKVYGVCVCVSIMLLGLALKENHNPLRKNWVKHELPPYAQNSLPTKERTVAPAYPAVRMPANGTVRKFVPNDSIAPLEIRAAQGSNFLVKLVDTGTGNPVLTVFVRSGSTIEAQIPLGVYEIRYASGDTWYGDEYLFGPDTTYSKANKDFTFVRKPGGVSGYTITLYKVANGNLRTASITPDAF